MPEWKEYTGSDEQIVDMRSGFIFRDINGEQCNLIKKSFDFVSDTHLRNYLASCECVEVLICNPHTHADMICQQARTGQPVFVKVDKDSCGNKINMIYVTTTPDWNLEAEYSFTEFEDEVIDPDDSDSLDEYGYTREDEDWFFDSDGKP